MISDCHCDSQTFTIDERILQRSLVFTMIYRCASFNICSEIGVFFPKKRLQGESIFWRKSHNSPIISTSGPSLYRDYIIPKELWCYSALHMKKRRWQLKIISSTSWTPISHLSYAYAYGINYVYVCLHVNKNKS